VISDSTYLGFSRNTGEIQRSSFRSLGICADSEAKTAAFRFLDIAGADRHNHLVARVFWARLFVSAA